jgi:uncharacterized RDD family membrane protein YckC
LARLLGAQELFMLLFDTLGSLPSPIHRAVSFSNIGVLGLGTFFVLTSVAFAYFTYFESRRGASPGKWVFGLLVVDDEGLPPSRKAAMARNVTKALVYGLPLIIVVEAILVWLDRRRRRLTELYAKTTVVAIQ